VLRLLSLCAQLIYPVFIGKAADFYHKEAKPACRQAGETKGQPIN